MKQQQGTTRKMLRELSLRDLLVLICTALTTTAKIFALHSKWRSLWRSHGHQNQKRLFDYLSKQNLLTKQQFGFRHNRSTELSATLFTDDIRKHVDYKNLVGCLFIDFSKAFDILPMLSF